VEVEGVEARCSDNFVCLAPGRPLRIDVAPARPLEPAEFREALRVRSLYDTYQP